MPVEYIPHPIRATVTFPVRALNTVYQNNRLRPILVIITTNHAWINVNHCRADAYIGPTNPPLLYIADVGFFATPGGAVPQNVYHTWNFMVPAGYYYRAGTFVGPPPNAVTLINWTEVEL